MTTTMNPVASPAPRFVLAPKRVPGGSQARRASLLSRLSAWLQSLIAELLSWDAGSERFV